jgi:hypothetical protein
MLLFPFLNLFYILRKIQKQVKFTAVSLKAEPHFSFLLNFFFSLDNAKKKLYADIPKIINFNPKASIQKYPTLSSCYNFFSVNVSDFYTYFTFYTAKY